jgi:hypothetical protein
MRRERGRGARRWYDRFSRYLALIAFALTLVSTTVVFFASGSDNGALKDLIAACLGLLGAAVALQLEMLFRLTERGATRDRFSRVLHGLEEFPELLPLVGNQVEASILTLRRTSIPQFRDEVYSVVAHATARLDELSQGRLLLDGADDTLVLEQFAHTRDQIRGTTDESDSAWWLSQAGKSFLELNQRLIDDRKVRVERIWILDGAPDDKLASVLEQHRQLGVHVFLADRRELDRKLLVNMTLSDERLLQEDIANKEGYAVGYRYSWNKSDIDRAIRTFGQLKGQAAEYSGPDSLAVIFPPADDTRSTGPDRGALA